MMWLSSLTRHLKVLHIQWTKVLEFRLRALVWFIVGGMNTTILLMYWLATLRAGDPQSSLVTLSGIISYYLLMVTVATVTNSHIEEDIAYRDIFRGDIYSYILRPYPYLLLKFQEEIVWRILGGVWALLTIGILFLIGLRLEILLQPHIWLLTFISIALGIGTSFFFKCILGLTSVWLTNIRGAMELAVIVEITLAGFVIPLHLLPGMMKTVALYSPFAVHAYYPVRILSTALSPAEVLKILGIQLFWLLFLGVAANKLYRLALTKYTGVSQ